MLNHQQSVVYGLSLFPWLVSFVFLGKLASVGAVFRTMILWRWKFRELPQSIFWQTRGKGG
ncbi:hypothetical protein ABMY12_22760 [Vibrio vulnificus]|uniref:hypothetical protein n=1 Tax=Vibrio vulnificus TaxID=672 RepID=UPI004059B2B0